MAGTKGLHKVDVAWEEQANGPEGAYCRVDMFYGKLSVTSSVATFYYACDICPGLFIYFNAPCPRTEYDKAHIQMYGHHMGRRST